MSQLVRDLDFGIGSEASRWVTAVVVFVQFNLEHDELPPRGRNGPPRLLLLICISRASNKNSFQNRSRRRSSEPRTPGLCAQCKHSQHAAPSSRREQSGRSATRDRSDLSASRTARPSRHREEATCRAASERPPVHHWITSSARSSIVGGIVSPSALAVLRLITNSNLVGCSIGRSPAFAPRRILSTEAAARR